MTDVVLMESRGFNSATAMTRAVVHEFGDGMQKDGVVPVSADVNFLSNGFPDYRIGVDNNVIIEPEEVPDVPSLKEIVAVEATQLIEQQKRLSVRVLAEKFEKGLAAAAKLSDEAKWNDVVALDRHVLLKKLRDVLETLKGRVAGRNKDDAEEAISMVEALAVQLTHREGELLQEKTEVRKLATFLKQASEDAKKLVEDERALARAEIENARAAVQRIQEVLQEQERIYGSTGKKTKELEELMKEVQEARRIKMLHQPSRVMDMELELQGLRIQLAEKSLYCIQLRKEVAMNKRCEENKSSLYALDGTESLGSCLHISPRMDTALDISHCSIQWYRVQNEGSKRELISGATKPVYAPEPFDVGRFLEAEIHINDEIVTLKTTDPIDPAPGLGNYVEALLRKPSTEFNVVVTQMNGRDQSSHSIHVFHVDKMRIKLCKGKSTKARESYSTSMQLCGVRGGGNAAAQALFWQARKGHSFTLAFESARERNAAIMLARRFASDCNVMLAGPNDQTPVRN